MAGILKTKDLKRRVILLEDYLRMIIEIKGQINYFRGTFRLTFLTKLRKNGDSKAFSLLNGLRGQENRGKKAVIWSKSGL